MSSNGRRHTTHTIDVDAPPDAVYGIVADAPAWPQHFTPTVHVERSAVSGTEERLRIWATANDDITSWASRRTLDPGRHRVEFRQEVSAPPVASMGGRWTAGPLPGGRTRLVLEHDFTAVGDDPDGITWISRATDRNSRTELANIKRIAEARDRLGDLVFTFEDSTVVRAPRADVYAFLYDAAAWPVRLPHVSRLDLKEEVQNVQWMSMETRTADGSAHTTESVRICFPDERIVYKQLRTPSLMTAHTGVWELEETGDGVRAISWHTVTVNEDNIAAVLGPDATVADARAFIRKAAGGNSAATLALAKEFAESGGRE